MRAFCAWRVYTFSGYDDEGRRNRLTGLPATRKDLLVLKPLLVTKEEESAVDWSHSALRYGIYAVGLFCISLGTVLQTASGLGVSSLTCFATFAARVGGTSLGFMISATYALYIVAQALILRRRFQPRILLEMLVASAMGALVDLLSLVVTVNPQGLPAQVTCMLCSICVTALGASLMVDMEIVPNAPDGLVQVASEALHAPFGRIKVIFDVSHVVVSILGSLLIFGDISGFGLTTVASALLLGRAINVIMNTVGQRAQDVVWA